MSNPRPRAAKQPEQPALPGAEVARKDPAAAPRGPGGGQLDAIDGARIEPAQFVFPTPDNEVFIPVSGLVRLTDPEQALVDHPAFQRLTEINQLGMTYLVYPGATHKRGEHALGTLHMATLMMDAVDRNLTSAARRRVDVQAKWRPDDPFSPAERAFVRLGALLHDIGHLSNGHTFEDELGVLPPHDADERLNLVLDKRVWHGSNVPSLRDLIDDYYREAAAAAGLSDTHPSEILLDLVSKDRVSKTYADSRLRLGVCRDLIGNTFCADLMDYIHRDWHHIGRVRAVDIRLLDYLEIRRNLVDDLGAAERSRLVLNLRGGPKLRTDAITGILELLESRYQLCEIALFHRTKINATAMLERVVGELSDRTKDEYFPDTDALLACSDREVLTLLDRKLQDLAATTKVSEDSSLAPMRGLLSALRVRRLHKLAKAWHPEDLPLHASVQSDYGGDLVPSAENTPETRRSAAARAAQNRLKLARCLEQDFELPAGSVAIYCPPARMNTKVAAVQIMIDGEVQPLERYEESHGDRLTAGHLKAQKERFRRLWRFHLAIEAAALADLRERGLEAVLLDTVSQLVLGDRPAGAAERLAGELGQRLAEHDVATVRYTVRPPAMASRTDSSREERYPNGQHLLRTYLVTSD